MRAAYTLEFVQVADELEIGFEAQGATGNWLAVDNFVLEYISDNFDDVKAEFAALIAKAETLAGQRMNSTAQQALADAIATATPLIEQTDTDGWAAAATALEKAYAAAVASHEVFVRLANAIAAAKEEIENPIRLNIRLPSMPPKPSMMPRPQPMLRRRLPSLPWPKLRLPLR